VRRLVAILVALLLSLAWALELVFLDVGQGDAVLIRSPSGQVALYDAGEREANVLGLLRALGVEHIDLVIASHAHADHIGGMAEVILHYRPRFYMDNGVPHTTLTYERTLDAVLEVGAQLLEPTARRITLGEVVLYVVPPPGIEAWGQNDNSVGILIEYGEFRAFLPGDAEPRQWRWWLEHHPELLVSVQIHRASHHGSRNGDIPEALALLSPDIVIVSAGAGNRYGHPHAEALALYAEVSAEVYRTDLHGHITVIAEQDGSYRIGTQRAVAPAQLEPSPPPSPAVQCVDINRASIEELRHIVHIDIERAQQIVQLRGQRPFTRVDELTRVRGIGDARLRDIKAQGLACVP
jgi:beta-lactamase superfamily II metal-dependent hydrolase